MPQYSAISLQELFEYRFDHLVLPCPGGRLPTMEWLEPELTLGIHQTLEHESRRKAQEDAEAESTLALHPLTDSKFGEVRLLLTAPKIPVQSPGEQARSLLASLLEVAKGPSRSVLIPAERFVDTAGALPQFIQHLLTALAWHLDQSDRFKSKPFRKPFRGLLQNVSFLVESESLRPLVEQAIDRAARYAQARQRCCQLANLPANLCRPVHLLQAAQQLADAYPDQLQVRYKDAEELERLGMQGILSVGKGSDSPPYLIELHYRGKGQPSPSSQAPVALVGKGVTFDSGGISIKPANNMHHMKYDMCGAATLFGVMEGACLLGLRSPLVALIPACENLLSGSSYRPGDVLKMHSGLTVEVLNTDAEGRLALADALSYAEKAFAPKQIIDVATLTGACVVALGWIRTGLVSNDDDLQSKLLASGEAEGDLAWALPFDQGYDEAFQSQVADWANAGSGNRGAGTVTAARFLSKFIQGTPWAHLDIAGTAYTSGSRVRATGRPVSLLLNYLESIQLA